MNGCSAGENKKGFWNDAGLHVTQQLQSNGTGTSALLRGEETQVAAASIVLGTWICSWKGKQFFEEENLAKIECHVPHGYRHWGGRGGKKEMGGKLKSFSLCNRKFSPASTPCAPLNLFLGSVPKPSKADMGTTWGELRDEILPGWCKYLH